MLREHFASLSYVFMFWTPSFISFQALARDRRTPQPLIQVKRIFTVNKATGYWRGIPRNRDNYHLKQDIIARTFTPRTRQQKNEGKCSASYTQLFQWRHSHCIPQVTPVILTADDREYTGSTRRKLTQVRFTYRRMRYRKGWERHLKLKLRGISLRANYSDRATAACWRS
jgi:hypothetical protein